MLSVGVVFSHMMSDIGLEQEIQTGPDSEYRAESLEAHWQDVWRARRAFAAPAPEDERAPAYVFADCPVTSGENHIERIRTFTIADACARSLRARGRAVLFSLAFDSFGAHAEQGAVRMGVSPREWVQRCREQVCGQLESLGCSCDWERTFVSSESDSYRWTQWLFLAMLERGLIYRRANRWFMRIDTYIDENERGLAALTGWDGAAIERQRAAIGRVHGVEMRASTLSGGELTVFTPHAEAIAKATFVAISPAHAEIGQWTADPVLAEQVEGMREIDWQCAGEDAEQIPMALTDALATVPGVAGMLPIVISPLVDARFGPTAVLGIPELDSTDREIATRLPTPPGTTWKVSSSGATTRPAVRYRARDLAISSSQPWGAPIPLVDCPACGTVPVPLDDLPVRLPDELHTAGESDNPLAESTALSQCTCPRCGGAALRETGTIDSCMDRMWMWMPICVPTERRASAMMNDSEYARWLPVEQVVFHVDAAARMFERRLLAEFLQDIGELPPLPDREPFSKALMHEGVQLQEATISEHLGNVVDLDALVARVGSDTVRLAMLYAASPGRAFSWNDQPLRHCQRFLQRLHGYAEPRLREWARLRDRTPEQASIDTSDKLHRRLAHWCAVACEKVTLQLEGLELHRAAHNVMRLAIRIEDFESRVLERGEIEPRDREATVAALLLLVRLLAPLTPHIAEELWSAAGNTELVSDAGWPALSRPARADHRNDGVLQ
jgi:leucyl-tRNA synthetase